MSVEQSFDYERSSKQNTPFLAFRNILEKTYVGYPVS